MKKIFIIILFLLSVNFNSNAQITHHKTINREQISTTYMTLDNVDKCIYFPSMEWFSIVECRDCNGKKMLSFNVQYTAEHQNTQFVSMSYKDFEDGEYVILLKSRTRVEIVTLRIFDNNTYAILCDSN